ncbi:MAG: glycosyltransferase family 4 protein [Acidobacteriota bacterium]|nr:glycosyltransferase family 4 protein [Acidobacteriota bacterium]
MPLSTLYLCYFGLREPLVQTQVLPYLRQLAASGMGVRLLTFEPELKKSWTPEQLDEERSRLAAEGIRWHSLAYHKRPSVPATAFDIFAGALYAARLARRERIQVLHARSHVPVAMALIARRLARCRTVFDVRGLLAEEYEDAGIWRAGSLPFRAIKRLERAGLRRADGVVVLTRRMREWLAEQGLAEADKVEVIPCCVDFARYDAARDERKSERFEVVYAGSVVGLYLLEEMARFFLAVRARREGAFFRVLTTSPAEETSERLRRAGLNEEEFGVERARADEVPRLLARAHLGVSFRKATFSQIAASPTKIPEYLAAGLPVVSNRGIGDTDELLARARVGVLVRDFDEESLARAAEEALRLADDPVVAARCVETAREVFDLRSVGGRRYLNVYRRLEEAPAEALARADDARL